MLSIRILEHTIHTFFLDMEAVQGTRYTEQGYPVFASRSSTLTFSPSYTCPVVHPSPQFILFGPIAPRWTLIRPLLVTLIRNKDGCVTVFSSEFNLYGIGEIVEEAIHDFISMLIDLYEELNASEAVLSTHLVQRLSELRNIITVR